VAQAEVKSLQRIYSAWQRRDTAELRSSLAHDVEWIIPDAVPWGGVHHGPDGVEALVEIFDEHVEGIWADPDDFLQDGDWIVVLGRISGSGRISGQHFEVPFAHVWGMTDGVPSHFRSYFDATPIMAALAGEAPAGIEPA
jgi:ketosteroid isomerase-like protein